MNVMFCRGDLPDGQATFHLILSLHNSSYELCAVYRFPWTSVCDNSATCQLPFVNKILYWSTLCPYLCLPIQGIWRTMGRCHTWDPSGLVVRPKLFSLVVFVAQPQRWIWVVFHLLLMKLNEHTLLLRTCLYFFCACLFIMPSSLFPLLWLLLQSGHCVQMCQSSKSPFKVFSKCLTQCF